MTELIRLYPSKKETWFQFSIAIVALYFAFLFYLAVPGEDENENKEDQNAAVVSGGE